MVELAFAILVWNGKLRPWVLLLGVMLHLGIEYAVRVGFFFAALVAYVAFLPPETVSVWVYRLGIDWPGAGSPGWCRASSESSLSSPEAGHERGHPPV